MRPLPWVTFTLILAQLAVAAFTLGDSDAAYSWGFIPKEGFLERTVTIFTSLFVHVDPIHLLGNLLFLAAVGPVVESAAGAIRFGVVYLLSGIFGVFVHSMMVLAAQPNIASEPLIGSSAATVGLIGYSWLRFYRFRVPVAPGWKVPVFVIAIVWVILQVAGGFWSNIQLGSENSYWSHLGGFLIGFSLAILFGARKAALEESYAPVLEEARTRSPQALINAAKEILTQNPDSLFALKALAEGFLAQNDHEEALKALEKMLDKDPLYENAFAVKKISELRGWERIPSVRRLRIAEQLLPSQPEVAEHILQSILRESRDATTVHALAMMLDIVAKSDPTSARHYASELEKHFPFSPVTEIARSKYPELFLRKA
ncbi:MAG TPA: rhomboid family intramembrane serine protease [Fimbriimonadales bacterium]|nr:rhomboid family intramembrane serine protease [Fimbriimonadales bacterium]